MENEPCKSCLSISTLLLTWGIYSRVSSINRLYNRDDTCMSYRSGYEYSGLQRVVQRDYSCRYLLVHRIRPGSAEGYSVKLLMDVQRCRLSKRYWNMATRTVFIDTIKVEQTPRLCLVFLSIIIIPFISRRYEYYPLT